MKKKRVAVTPAVAKAAAAAMKETLPAGPRKSKWKKDADPNHFLTGRARSARSIARFRRTMRLKRKAAKAAMKEENGAGGAVELSSNGKLNGKVMHFPLDAIPGDPPAFLRRRQAEEQARGMQIDVKAGSQMTVTFGGVSVTLRAVE